MRSNKEFTVYSITPHPISAVNILIHSLNLIMITPCLSRTIHLFLVHHYHILSHLPLSHCPSLLLCFTLGLKLTPSINTSHRKYLVPIGLPFPDFTTASCVFSQAHRFFFGLSFGFFSVFVFVLAHATG